MTIPVLCPLCAQADGVGSVLVAERCKVHGDVSAYLQPVDIVLDGRVVGTTATGVRR